MPRNHRRVKTDVRTVNLGPEDLLLLREFKGLLTAQAAAIQEMVAKHNAATTQLANVFARRLAERGSVDLGFYQLDLDNEQWVPRPLKLKGSGAGAIP